MRISTCKPDFILLVAAAAVAAACPGKPPKPDETPVTPGTPVTPETPITPEVCDATAAHQLAIDATPDQPLGMQFKASFDERGEFVAPTARVTVAGVDKPFALRVGATREAWAPIGEKIAAAGARATTVVFAVKTETTFGTVAEQASGGPIEVPAGCSVTVGFEGGATTEGAMECLAQVLLVMDPPAAGCGTFDCHSHWGVASTRCHCNTAGCCPGERCQCRWDGAQTCGGWQFCFCD